MTSTTRIKTLWRLVFAGIALLLTQTSVFAYDSFDATTGAVTIPVVKVDTSFYWNVTVTLSAVVSVGKAPATSNYDTYNASTQQLSIPSVMVNGTEFNNVVVVIDKVLSVEGGIQPNAEMVAASTIAAYDATSGLLSIPVLQAGTSTYNNATVAISSIISVGPANAAININSLNTANNQVTIPLVIVGSHAYSNVVIGLSAITCKAPQVLQNGVCATPAPTVEISIDTANIVLGQAAKVNWSSTNATACTASLAWTGTRAVNDTENVSPTAIANYSYKLTCTGAGGTASQTTTLTVIASTNPCSVASHVYGDITQPSNYSGAFAVPTPAQKLPAQVTKAIGLKDYYPGYTGGSSGCKDRNALARYQYLETLNRLQAIRVTQTFIYNYGQWDDFSKQVWTVSPANYSVPSSELAFVVAEAAKRNIKVVLAWQFTDRDLVGGNLSMGSPVTSTRLRQMLDSFHALIVNQATIGSQNGLGGIYIDWHAFWIPNLSSDPVLREMWITEMVSIAADVKKVFSGKILYGANTTIIDPRLAAVIDQYTLSLTVPYNSINTAENNALTVDMVKAAYLTSIQQAKADYVSQMNGSSISVPINWAVSVQSKKDYFINGWTEDGFCVNSCIQLTYVTDNSVQAIGFEAAFEAIMAQSQFTTAAIDFDTSYWLTDDIGPDNLGWDAYANLIQYDFPNLSQSIRNKPAEGIVRYWFGK
jgi:hypothetical protein